MTIKSNSKQDMTDRQITLVIGNMVCEVIPMTTREYCDCDQKSIAIFENYEHYFPIDRQAPNFDYPRLYAALKTLFGESSTTYDDYKCSFAYQFLLEITRKDKKSEYALNVTDVKGGISFKFWKILSNLEDLEKYKDRSILYERLEDDFSKHEIGYFMTWFMFYLVGFMKSFENHYTEEFARSQVYCNMIYGYKDNRFFLDQYENRDEFYAAESRLLKNTNIPYNRVSANRLMPILCQQFSGKD